MNLSRLCCCVTWSFPNRHECGAYNFILGSVLMEFEAAAIWIVPSRWLPDGVWLTKQALIGIDVLISRILPIQMSHYKFSCRGASIHHSDLAFLQLSRIRGRLDGLSIILAGLTVCHGRWWPWFYNLLVVQNCPAIDSKDLVYALFARLGAHWHGIIFVVAHIILWRALALKLRCALVAEPWGMLLEAL